ncbi:metallophosphoesterase family protein [Halovenus rubra]|uniref:Metallophosphoesterase family protein n=2 Tax=Halovenus rubra TaxID=869890 RepID=A0ABD5X337_9EURY
MTTVGILTDIHMRTEYRSEVADSLLTIYETLSHHNPDHVFVLGDLIQDSDDPDTDKEHVELVAELLAPFQVTYLLGNHDTVNLTRAEIGEIVGQETFYGQLTIDDTTFVYLDSQMGDHRVLGEVDESQREWVATTMDSEPVVLVHHPIAPFSLRNNPWFSDAPARAFLRNQQAVLDTVCPAARATVSGHIHQTTALRYRGVPHLSVNAVSKETEDRPVTGTWALLDFEDRLTADLFVEDTHQRTLQLK